MPGVLWVTEPERWERLAERLRQAGEFAIDAETYGQPEKTSPQHRARVHCWSVAVLSERRSPRGHRIATGAVLPAGALECLALREVLRSHSILKWAHNAPHDYHALTNMGCEVHGLEDTLQWARVAVPGMDGYGLKDLEGWALGKPPRENFRELVTHKVKVTRTSWRTERRCACGKVPCRARGASEWWDAELGWWQLHERADVRVATEHEKEVDIRWEVTEFAPGHERWDRWLAYSLADAVSGMELVDWLRSRKVQKLAYPWRASG